MCVCVRACVHAYVCVGGGHTLLYEGERAWYTPTMNRLALNNNGGEGIGNTCMYILLMHARYGMPLCAHDRAYYCTYTSAVVLA